MAHTPLLRSLRRLFAQHRYALRTGTPIAEVQARAAAELRARPASGASVTRRALLAGSAAIAAGALLPFKLRCGGGGGGGGGSTGAAPRIAIVGGGIAGLTAALTLADAGYRATVYEVSKERVGGRLATERGAEPTGCGICHAAPGNATNMSWSDGQVADIYGELVDSGFEVFRGLADRFGLAQTDALAAEPAGATETYHFDGGYYTKAEVDQDFAALYAALQADAEAAGYPTTFAQSTAAGRELDNLSIRAWIESRVPGGFGSRLGKLLDVAYNIEYGAETSDQSALSLIYMLSGAAADNFSVFGESDEGWRIQGGVDQVPRAIADHLGIGDVVLLGHEFQALRAESDGTVTLSFDSPAGATEVRADYVILAIPFSKLRTLDFARAGFDERKTTAIRELGAGRNGKLQLQFTRRLWNEAGPWGVSGGTSYSDRGYQLAWDPTRGQPGTSGILVSYTGGDVAAAKRISHPYGNNGNPTVVADAEEFLTQIEPVFPGLTALWNGKCCETMSHLDSRFLSSYAYWRVGQYQTIAGYEQVRQGNVFFAGEHTSVDYQGFMEGAASEGKRAAEELLALLPARA